jgi:hypothetical protein
MPIIIIPDKICPCCGNNKWYTHKGKYNIYLYCSTRKNKKVREYYNNNKEICQKRDKKWGINNPERLKAAQKEHYLNNIDKARESARQWKKRNKEKLKTLKKQSIDNLEVPYIKGLLYNKDVLFKDITPELIELKRKQIKLCRHVKQTKISNAANC